MKVLDLFAGIGGFSLGLERTGYFKTVAFCEYDRKAREVLHKNWPSVPVYPDVRKLTGEQLKKDGISIDVITGGFPCQDLSFAGRGAGLSGERSGLWFEYLRLIKEITPKWVIIENVSALRSRGLDEVLRGLSEVGYDAEWHCIPASALGAPHQRDRIWIVGYPRGELQHILLDAGSAEGSRSSASTGTVHSGNASGAQSMADTSSPRREAGIPEEGHRQEGYSKITDYLSHRLSWWPGSGIWAVEPDVGRVADGVPGRVDRLKQLGNAVVPQIPELIGRAIHAASTT